MVFEFVMFGAIWIIGIALLLGRVIDKNHQKPVEKYEATMTKNPDAFKDCTNCVRYFDTVICKCKKTEEQVAFMYPTDITPDIDLSAIKLGPETDVKVTKGVEEQTEGQ